MCGKGPTQLIRLAVIIQVIHDAFDYVKERHPGLVSITNEIESEIENSEGECIISVDNLNRAWSLLEWFNKNKLILSGFDFNNWETTNINDIFKFLIGQLSFDQKIKQPSIANIIYSYVLLSEKTEFKKNDINQALKHKGVTSIDIDKALQTLQSHKLGKLSKTSNTRGKPTEIFMKKVFGELNDGIISSIDKLEINLDKFITINQLLESAELLESEEEFNGLQESK